MNKKLFFKFEEVEQVELPCAGCFWGGAGLIVAGIGITATIAT